LPAAVSRMRAFTPSMLLRRSSDPKPVWCPNRDPWQCGEPVMSA
jgi:hypothetical protein